ncbi:MAG TPA: hypothetical protein VIV11_18270 [Kofleriaceae bacterium]
MVIACGIARADVELPTDPEPPPPAPAQLATDPAPVQIASAGRCSKITRLVAQDSALVSRTLRAHKLQAIKLEAIVLPRIVEPASQSSLTTIRIGKRTVRGLLVNLSGDGCVRPDHRHALDRDGNLYQFDGPAHVVDYKTNRCHTTRGWERCNLAGQTHVLYVVPARVGRVAGLFGSDGTYFPQ